MVAFKLYGTWNPPEDCFCFLGSVDVAVVFTPAHGAQVMIGFFWRLTELQFEVYLASIESTICCVICFPDPIHSGVCGVSGCYIGVWGVKVCPGPHHPCTHTGCTVLATLILIGCTVLLPLYLYICRVLGALYLLPLYRGCTVLDTTLLLIHTGCTVLATLILIHTGQTLLSTRILN